MTYMEDETGQFNKVVLAPIIAFSVFSSIITGKQRSRDHRRHPGGHAPKIGGHAPRNGWTAPQISGHAPSRAPAAPPLDF